MKNRLAARKTWPVGSAAGGPVKQWRRERRRRRPRGIPGKSNDELGCARWYFSYFLLQPWYCLIFFPWKTQCWILFFRAKRCRIPHQYGHGHEKLWPIPNSHLVLNKSPENRWPLTLFFASTKKGENTGDLEFSMKLSFAVNGVIYDKYNYMYNIYSMYIYIYIYIFVI